YCAELNKLPKHPGVLIITRFTEEADKLAALINGLTKDKTAITRHSKVAVKDVTIQKAPVLIITHAAYLRAMSAIDKITEVSERWQKIIAWQGGERRLTVIDETLNTPEQVSIGLDELRMFRGLVSYNLEQKYSTEVTALDAVIGKFESIVKAQA